MTKENFLVVGGKARSLGRHRGPLLRDLIRADFKVIAMAPSDGEWDDAPRELGAEFHPVPVDRHGRFGAGDVLLAKAVFDACRKYRPVGVLTYTIKPAIWATLGARFAGVKSRHVLITGLGQAFAPGKGTQAVVRAGAKLLYKLSLAGAASVIFQNQDDCEQFVTGRLVARKRTHVVPGSGVDLEHFDRRPMPEEFRLFWMGRLLADKGLTELVDAMSIVKQSHPEAVLHVLGLSEPSHPAALSEEQIEKWAKAGIIVRHDPVDDVRPFVAQGSVLAFPSYREGTSRSVLECMAMGRSVITSDGPGCWQTVDDGRSGFIVPVGDHTLLAERIGRFFADPELAARMGDAAFERAAEVYEVGTVNARMLAIMGVESGSRSGSREAHERSGLENES